MNIMQIKYLMDVASSHSFHKTAEKYHISPQGVSKAIHMLEQELNITLLESSVKGSSLTAAGVSLSLYFVNMLENYDGVLDYCRRQSCRPNPTEITGSIQLAVAPRLADSYIGDIVCQFSQHYPQIEITLISIGSDDLFRKMASAEENIDLALIILLDDDAQNNAIANFLAENGLRFVPCCTRELYVCGLKKTIQSMGGRALQSQLAISPTAVYQYIPFPFPLGEPMKDERKSQYQINSVSAQLNLINNNQAVGFFSKDEFQKYFSGKKHAYIPFAPPIWLCYGYVRNNRRPAAQSTEIFTRFLLSYFSSLP